MSTNKNNNKRKLEATTEKDCIDTITNGDCVQKDLANYLDKNLKEANSHNNQITKLRIANVKLLNDNVIKYNTNLESWACLIELMPTDTFHKSIIKGCILYHILDNDDRVQTTYKNMITRYKNHMRDKVEYMINIFDKINLKSLILKQNMLDNMHDDIMQHVLINYEIQVQNGLRDSYLAEYYKQIAISKGVM